MSLSFKFKTFYKKFIARVKGSKPPYIEPAFHLNRIVEDFISEYPSTPKVRKTNVESILAAVEQRCEAVRTQLLATRADSSTRKKIFIPNDQTAITSPFLGRVDDLTEIYLEKIDESLNRFNLKFRPLVVNYKKTGRITQEDYIRAYGQIENPKVPSFESLTSNSIQLNTLVFELLSEERSLKYTKDSLIDVKKRLKETYALSRRINEIGQKRLPYVNNQKNPDYKPEDMELLSRTFTFFYPVKAKGIVIPTIGSTEEFELKAKTYDIPGILPELLDQYFYLYLRGTKVSRMYEKLFLFENQEKLDEANPLERSNSI